jgi:PDZ domain-containing protein
LAWAAAVITFLVIAGVLAASTITVPYYAIRPGVARQTNDLVVVPDDKRMPPSGQVLFVTVGVQRLRALQYVLAKRDPDVDVVPEEAILGKADTKQYEQRSTQAMVDSKETAAVIALERLCLPVKEKGTGARVQEVAAGSPADKAGLRAEDTITAVGGTPVTTADAALAPLRAAKPQTPVTLTVVGPAETDAPRQITATLGTNPTDPARSYLGVVLRTRAQDFDLPFDVTVESGRVGGPSAGLAFTLALLDQLTPGELTGGGKVAATGTIELDGSVGLVGGVPQKAVAVRRSGAKLFIVPSAELKEAKAKIGSSVEVVPADTLEQALAALKAHGGDLSGIPASCPGS